MHGVVHLSNTTLTLVSFPGLSPQAYLPRLFILQGTKGEISLGLGWERGYFNTVCSLLYRGMNGR